MSTHRLKYKYWWGYWRIISSKKIIAEVYGLFESKKLEIASFKEMENLCKSDYYKIEKKYPDWNFQENNTDYPKDEYLKYLEHHRKRQSKKHWRTYFIF